ncbi:MAG: hypothetical protein LQ343_004562 [Gyalolechia ehrenbergii]|nr:MAG: hypothetical protein LQ343_004562 [Gyalolechia ehrenbergii]
MPQKALSFAALLLSTITGVMAQSSSSVNPLNEFIGAANSAAAAINSANAKQTTPSSFSSPTSSSPTQAAATSASPSATAHPSGINRTTLIVAIVCAVVGALLIALLLGLCCWCLARRRRHRRNQEHASIDDEVKTWRSNEPKNPGRDYSPHRNSRITSMEQQPMIPPAAKAPDMQQHPALRNNNAENPFVPVPPSPRRQAPNSRAGLTDGTVPGAPPYVLPEPQVLHKGRSRSSSRPRTTSNPALPKTNTTSRPTTPFGLSGVGQPYEDMHVHVLQTESPSRELRQSLHNREPIVSPPTEPIHRYDTPPTVASRSPNRHSTASVPPNYNNSNTHTATNSVAGETSSTEGSTSADDWRYNKASSSTFANILPWEQRQHRYSNSPHSSTGNAYNITAPPPIPWEDPRAKYDSPSHSPRQSRDFRHSGNGNGNSTAGYVEGARRQSRSPATSINGQPRRLRFSDLQADEMGYHGYRHSQGVGEAL